MDNVGWCAVDLISLQENETQNNEIWVDNRKRSENPIWIKIENWMDRMKSYSIGLSGFEVCLLSDIIMIIIFNIFQISNELNRVSGNIFVVFALNWKGIQFSSCIMKIIRWLSFYYLAQRNHYLCANLCTNAVIWLEKWKIRRKRTH